MSESSVSAHSQKELSGIVGPIAAKNNVSRISLFGSRATNRATAESDYDFLIEVNNNFTFHDYCKLVDELEEALGTHVDIVYRTTLTDDIFSRRVLREAVHVWGRSRKNLFHSSPDVGVCDRIAFHMHHFGGKEQFLTDWSYQDSCVMILGQIGELAKTISVWLKNNSDYDWSDVIHFRDFIYHNYSRTLYPIVWGILSDEVPAISNELHILLEKIQSEYPHDLQHD